MNVVDFHSFGHVVVVRHLPDEDMADIPAFVVSDTSEGYGRVVVETFPSVDYGTVAVGTSPFVVEDTSALAAQVVICLAVT